jgi:hypothetical protein
MRESQKLRAKSMQTEQIISNHSISNHQLALLIAAPHRGERAMHNDLVDMYKVLSLRGLLPEEMLLLEGKLHRGLLMAFLQEVRKEIVSWSSGEVFFYYSGHGNYRTVASNARAGMLLKSNTKNHTDDYVFWDEVFSTLDLPTTINLVVLPDS